MTNSRVRWQIEDVTAHVEDRIVTGEGDTVRATWSVTVTLTAEARYGTAGVILSDLDARLAQDLEVDL